MERFREFMVVVISVLHLFYKLQNLLNYEEISPNRSNVPIEEAMLKLTSIFGKIRDAEELWITSDLFHVCQNDLLSRLANLEDVIDAIIAKTELQRQSIWYKMMSYLNSFVRLRDQRTLNNEIARFITYAEGLEMLREHAPLGPTGITSSHPWPRNVVNLAKDDLGSFVLRDKGDELSKELVKRKRGELNNVIAITGAAGSGKTVLAKRVFNMKFAKQYFKHHVWVNAYGDFEARDILKYILKQLSQKWLDENLQKNELELRLKQFSRENHCLIVIDDVRTTNDLDKLSVVLKCIGGQSRLVLTARNLDIARAASEQRNPICLRSLTDEESQFLFLKAARIAKDSFDSLDLINLIKDILRKCDGSPQSIRILGGLLSTRDLSDWHNVIEQLSTVDLSALSTQMPEVQGLSTTDKQELSSVIHPAAQEKILDLSNEDLSSQVKLCFHYFGFFPRAYEIPIWWLIHLWIFEGLVRPLPLEHIGAEVIAIGYVKQLICRNLIEVVEVKFDGSPKTCRMPGNVWDVFHEKAVNIRNFHVYNNTASTPAESPGFNIRQLVEMQGSEIILLQNFTQILGRFDAYPYF